MIHIGKVFFRKGITVPNPIIVEYMWQILGGGGIFAPPPPYTVSSPEKVDSE